MNWLTRLKKSAPCGIPSQKPEAPDSEQTGFSGHDPCNASTPATGASPASPAQDPDRWCWPYSQAMTGREIDTFAGRAMLFSRHAMPPVNAEGLAYQLVNRDREGDDRRLCLECCNLTGRAGAWRCNQWQQAGMVGAGVPSGMVLVLQRCNGFKAAR